MGIIIFNQLYKILQDDALMHLYTASRIAGAGMVAGAMLLPYLTGNSEFADYAWPFILGAGIPIFFLPEFDKRIRRDRARERVEQTIRALEREMNEAYLSMR